MQRWVHSKWIHILSYLPKMSRFVNDWFSFHFLHQDDLQQIRQLPWVWGRNFLFLHNWYVGFNPLWNTLKKNFVQVKLPGLPLEFWTHRVLSEIENSIGHFIYVDPKCLGPSDKCVACILVELGFSGVLPGQIDLAWDHVVQRKCLNYWYIPFQCPLCHHTGHLLENFPCRLSHGGYHRHRDGR